MSENHRLTIIGIGHSKCNAKFLYKQNESTNIPSKQSCIYDSLRSAFKDTESASMFNSLSMALIMAESYINRISLSETVDDTRLLILQASHEDLKDYIKTTQAAFHAQKHHIVIDVCRFSKSLPTSLLYSITEMTGGSYACLKNARELFFPLMFTFIMDPNSRKQIEQPIVIMNPPADSVSSCCCSCHKKTIDIGHVCSVCLTVYCKFIPVCRHCRTKFDLDVPIKQKT